MHAYMHIQTHMFLYTYLNGNIHTTYIHTHTCIIHIHICNMCIYGHICTHIYPNTSGYVHTHEYMHEGMSYVYICTSIHICINTYSDICIHILMYVCLYIYTYMYKFLQHMYIQSCYSYVIVM